MKMVEIGDLELKDCNKTIKDIDIKFSAVTYRGVIRLKKIVRV